MNYSKLAIKTKNLITRYGAAITLLHHNPGTFDPIQGHYVGGGTISCTGNGVVKFPNQRNDKFIEGTLIETGDRELLIATGATLTPGPGDYISLGTVLYSIIAVAPLEPALTTLMYKALIRR